jgi:hypothetical protein
MFTKIEYTKESLYVPFRLEGPSDWHAFRMKMTLFLEHKGLWARAHNLDYAVADPDKDRYVSCLILSAVSDTVAHCISKLGWNSHWSTPTLWTAIKMLMDPSAKCTDDVVRVRESIS